MKKLHSAKGATETVHAESADRELDLARQVLSHLATKDKSPVRTELGSRSGLIAATEARRPGGVPVRYKSGREGRVLVYEARRYVAVAPDDSAAPSTEYQATLRAIHALVVEGDVELFVRMTIRSLAGSAARAARLDILGLLPIDKLREYVVKFDWQLSSYEQLQQWAATCARAAYAAAMSIDQSRKDSVVRAHATAYGQRRKRQAAASTLDVGERFITLLAEELPRGFAAGNEALHQEMNTIRRRMRRRIARSATN